MKCLVLQCVITGEFHCEIWLSVSGGAAPFRLELSTARRGAPRIDALAAAFPLPPDLLPRDVWLHLSIDLDQLAAAAGVAKGYVVDRISIGPSTRLRRIIARNTPLPVPHIAGLTLPPAFEYAPGVPCLGVCFPPSPAASPIHSPPVPTPPTPARAVSVEPAPPHRESPPRPTTAGYRPSDPGWQPGGEPPEPTRPSTAPAPRPGGRGGAGLRLVPPPAAARPSTASGPSARGARGRLGVPRTAVGGRGAGPTAARRDAVAKGVAPPPPAKEAAAAKATGGGKAAGVRRTLPTPPPSDGAGYDAARYAVHVVSPTPTPAASRGARDSPSPPHPPPRAKARAAAEGACGASTSDTRPLWRMGGVPAGATAWGDATAWRDPTWGGGGAEDGDGDEEYPLDDEYGGRSPPRVSDVWGAVDFGDGDGDADDAGDEA